MNLGRKQPFTRLIPKAELSGAQMMEKAIRTQDSTNYAPSLLTGFLIGGLVGFGTMLLLAPQPGSQTRTQIRQKSTELRDRTVDTFDDLVVLSYFDNRKILTGMREKIKDR